MESSLEATTSTTSLGTGPRGTGLVFKTPDANHGSRDARLESAYSSTASCKHGARGANPAGDQDGSPDGSRVKGPDSVGGGCTTKRGRATTRYHLRAGCRMRNTNRLKLLTPKGLWECHTPFLII